MWIYGAKTTLFMFEWQCSVQVGTDCQPYSLASSTHHHVPVVCPHLLLRVWKVGRGLLTPGLCSNNQSWTYVWNMKHALNKVGEGIRSLRHTKDMHESSDNFFGSVFLLLSRVWSTFASSVLLVQAPARAVNVVIRCRKGQTDTSVISWK